MMPAVCELAAVHVSRHCQIKIVPNKGQIETSNWPISPKSRTMDSKSYLRFFTCETQMSCMEYKGPFYLLDSSEGTPTLPSISRSFAPHSDGHPQWLN